MKATHAFTYNGDMHVELKGFGNSVETEIGRLLGRLDGQNLYSFSIWQLPPGRQLDQVDHNSWPENFIQAAGSKSQLTVEIRHVVDGTDLLETVGRSESRGGNPTAIRWNGYLSTVDSAEVWTSSEAAELFVDFYRERRPNAHLRPTDRASTRSLQASSGSHGSERAP